VKKVKQHQHLPINSLLLAQDTFADAAATTTTAAAVATTTTTTTAAAVATTTTTTTNNNNNNNNNMRLRVSRGSVLDFGIQIRGFAPSRNRRIFRAKKSSARLPSEGK
jgi:hypothetical protein